MRNALMIVRITGVAQLLLGVLIWMGQAGGLVPVHMLIGVIFVIGLWILGYRGVAGGQAVMGALVLLWGAVVVAFGMVQAQIMPGPNHAVVQLAHVVMGLLGMGLAEMLGKKLMAHLEPASHGAAS